MTSWTASQHFTFLYLIRQIMKYAKSDRGIRNYLVHHCPDTFFCVILAPYQMKLPFNFFLVPKWVWNTATSFHIILQSGMCHSSLNQGWCNFGWNRYFRLMQNPTRCFFSTHIYFKSAKTARNAICKRAFSISFYSFPARFYFIELFIKERICRFFPRNSPSRDVRVLIALITHREYSIPF